ncbi:MAG: DUF3990 domain-containing protein [Muribaculaceae bacterium]|nr:DUF3990 domain-containing protein [Muribaculaceae bacterium]
MKLYHGSNVKIERIDLDKSKPFKDFGKGFYLSDTKHQAEEWRLSKNFQILLPACIFKAAPMFILSYKMNWQQGR